MAFAEDDDFFSTLFGDAVMGNNDEHADDDKDNGWFYGFGIISVDDKGNVYVADMAKHRIQKFSPTGDFLAKWGSTGMEDGQFVLPTRIAFDSAGDLFVADAGNNRIQKFTSTGEFLETLDGFGEIGVQQIIHTEIAIDSEDNLYSLDVQSLSVHKISSAGEVLAEWELYPDEEEPKISTPHILSIDSDDNVYVADSHRIHVFSSDGELISKFDTFGTITDGSTDANPMAIDVSGNTYVREWDNGTITTFSRDGIKSPSQKFAALTSQELARFAIGVTLDGEGNLYAFDVLDFNVKKFDSDGNIVASFGERATEPIIHDQITYPESMAFDSEDNLYVESENRIFKFASDGKIIEKMKLVAGNDDDEVTQISDIAFDSSDDMYVSNEKNRIIKFTNDGEFIEEYDMTQTSVSEFYLDSMRMSMDGKNNNIYVVGRIASPDNAVQKFSSDGRFIASWNHDHDGSERDQSAMIPTAVTADHDENVYVAYYPSLIQKFSSDGEFLAELRSPQKEVQFLQITAMTVDSEDNLYVAAVDPNKIIKFSQDGKFVAEWGSTGHDAGQFLATSGIAVDSKDDIYVADTGNKRIQKFFNDRIVSEHSDTSQPDVDVSPEKDLSGQLLPSPSIDADDSTQDEELSQTQDISDSPLKQYKSETNANKIQCREFLVLVIKYDGSPACVTPVTKQHLMDRGWAKPNDIDKIRHDSESIKQNIIRMEDGRISLYPENTCASIDLELLTEHDMQRYQNDEGMLDENNTLQITDTDIDKVPIIEELIYAVHLAEFPHNDSAHVYFEGIDFVEYEFFLMDKMIDKYGGTQKDYFMKLDADYEERLTNPKLQGFSNEFLAPQIVYDGKVYSIGGTVFWTSDEGNLSMSVHLRDSVDETQKSVMLTGEDMQSIPKIRDAIENIGTVKESIHAHKGLPEDQWNEYRDWFEQKSQEQLNADYFRLIQYNEQFYSVGFGIC